MPIRQHVLTGAEEQAYLTASLRRFTLEGADLKLHEHGPFPDLHDVATLILRQGLRPEEALKLRREDLDLSAGTLMVAAGKTKAARRKLGLTSEARLILGRRMAGESEWLFPSPRRPGRHLEKLNGAQTLVARASGVKFVLYDLRHTFATRLAEAGVDAFTIAAILGHASTRVLSRYIHPTQEHQLNAMRIYESRLPKLLEGRA